MDDRELIATIRAALAQATPGPWWMDQMACYVWARDKAGDFTPLQIRGWGHLTGAGGLRLSDEQAVAVQRANGTLAANAPTWISALCDALERHLETSDTAKAQATEVQR